MNSMHLIENQDGDKPFFFTRLLEKHELHEFQAVRIEKDIVIPTRKTSMFSVSPDGSIMASLSHENSHVFMRLHKLHDTQARLETTIIVDDDVSEDISAVAVANNSTLIWATKTTIHVKRLHKGNMLDTEPQPNYRIYEIEQSTASMNTVSGLVSCPTNERVFFSMGADGMSRVFNMVWKDGRHSYEQKHMISNETEKKGCCVRETKFTDDEKTHFSKQKQDPPGLPTAINFSANGDLVAVGLETGRIAVWNVSGYEATKETSFKCEKPVVSVDILKSGIVSATCEAVHFGALDSKSEKLDEKVKYQEVIFAGFWDESTLCVAGNKDGKGFLLFYNHVKKQIKFCVEYRYKIEGKVFVNKALQRVYVGVKWAPDDEMRKNDDRKVKLQLLDHSIHIFQIYLK